MAHLSRTYLAYCDCKRKTPDGAAMETMTIAAAFTAGDSDNLMVGRNGVFWDRQGNDWDATITKIIDNPISIRQAFFSPYKRAMRWIGDQLAKRAADADAAASTRAQAAAGKVIDEVAGGDIAPPPPAPKPKIDAGVIAALSVAAGFILGALGSMLNAFFGLGAWMPIGVVALILAISGPSMIIAFFKLRQRNLGPLLDANGWAVNAKAKINIPFGRSLTQIPKLPPGSHRDLTDPYADKHTGRNWTIAILIVLAVLFSMWYFGCVQKHLPDGFPKSGFVKNREAIAANREKADTLMARITKEVADKQILPAEKDMRDLEDLKADLPNYVDKIKDLRKAVDQLQEAATAP
ncbi:MAG TPA: hypothetical protein VM008_08275 [Phycisphaerae bacterium]|nr:hypothetical protein [Phycisphaerae bacterium]